MLTLSWAQSIHVSDPLWIFRHRSQNWHQRFCVIVSNTGRERTFNHWFLRNLCQIWTLDFTVFVWQSDGMWTNCCTLCSFKWRFFKISHEVFSFASIAGHSSPHVFPGPLTVLSVSFWIRRVYKIEEMVDTQALEALLLQRVIRPSKCYTLSKTGITNTWEDLHERCKRFLFVWNFWWLLKEPSQKTPSI